MRLVVCLLALLTVGCSPAERREDLRATLAEAVNEANPGDELDLREVLGEGWSRLVVLPPYSPNEIAADALGFDWNVEGTPSQSQDGIAVVVLATEREVVGWFVIGRNEADFAQGGEPLIAPADPRPTRLR